MIPMVSKVKYNGLHVNLFNSFKHVAVAGNSITMSFSNVATKQPIATEYNKFNIVQYLDRPRATDFVWQYIPTFCVYCPLTQQIYLDYDLFNIESNKGVVVLPKGHLSSIHGIENYAVNNTNLMLVPNNNLSRAHLFDRKKRHKSVSAQGGLIQLSTSSNFFPIILKSDLKRLKNDVPFLMLRAIDISKLDSLSIFDKSQIQNTIIEKIANSVSQWGW